MDTPTQSDVRAALALLDLRQQKIVAGLWTVLLRHPARVHDREWVSEQLTHLTLLAGDFEAETPQDGVRAVQDYLHAHSDELLRAALLVFQRVGLDLAPRAAEGFTYEEAVRCGLQYLPNATSPLERDLGEQPLARLLVEQGLRPRDLVAASGEQLTHKMVQRALKGRRLTRNTMNKVKRAWERATAGTEAPAADELFDYEA